MPHAWCTGVVWSKVFGALSDGAGDSSPVLPTRACGDPRRDGLALPLRVTPGHGLGRL